MRRAIFEMEPLDGHTFEGFTIGQRWNGWACPLFTKEEAERLVRAWNALGYKADYDPAADLFRFASMNTSDDPDPDLGDEKAERFGPVVIDEITLYPIGAGAWIWDERQDASTLKQDLQQI